MLLSRNRKKENRWTYSFRVEVRSGSGAAVGYVVGCVYVKSMTSWGEPPDHTGEDDRPSAALGELDGPLDASFVEFRYCGSELKQLTIRHSCRKRRA